MNSLKLFCLAAATMLPYFASAQQMPQQLDRKNHDLVRNIRTKTRHEIIIPDVCGYKVVKTELHSHTIYSDGDVTPEFRVIEAWRDGLDAIAISDHIEYRPCDGDFAAYLKADKPESVDLNYAVDLVRSLVKGYGLTLIPATEITRKAQTIGHFNALFTTDNNLIPDPDPFVAIQNAKKQGAVVQCNHPGWARRDANLTETARRAISEGLIDGIECYNDNEFYQKSIEDGINNNLYICAGTDIHSTTDALWCDYGQYRNMTFVLATDTSAEAIKEGLLAKRTLAYGYGDICGRQDLLEQFFLASLEFKTNKADEDGYRDILITNKSSLPYYLITDFMSTGIKIEGLSSVLIGLDAGQKLTFTVQNMWYGIDKHPVITVTDLK